MRAGSMTWRQKHCWICKKDVARICETPNISPILAVLSITSCRDSTASRQAYELLRTDPRHPVLHFKKVGRFWSVRIGLHYHALAVEQEGDIVWFWIGSHADYDKLIG